LLCSSRGRASIKRTGCECDQRATAVSAVGAPLAAISTSGAAATRGRPASALAVNAVAKKADITAVTRTARQKAKAKVVVRMARSEKSVAVCIGVRCLAACDGDAGLRAELEQAGVRDAIIGRASHRNVRQDHGEGQDQGQ